MRFILALTMLAVAACSPSGEAGQTAAEPAAAAPDRSAMNAAQRAYAEANDRMHSAMGSNIPADADVAFVQGMIPHHQGAIDMARIVLEHGTDPENQALARAIIAAQEAEIQQMRAWLERRELPGADATGAQPAATSNGAAAEVDHSKMGH